MAIYSKSYIKCNEPDINKIYLDEKDPSEAKYQFLINKSETVGSNYCSDSSFY